MQSLLLLTLMVALNCVAWSQETAKVDPDHIKAGGYGYIIGSDEVCTVWWTEGSYKVMRDTPAPAKKDSEIKIWSAKNEYESVLVIVKPVRRMDNFRITVSELNDGLGNKIEDNNATIRKAEYVKVFKPTDSYGLPGWWPDPMPVYEGPGTIFAAENQPFLITFKVPDNIKAGNYSGNITLSSDGWKLSIPVKLKVWNFTLPVKPSMRSGFGFDFNSVIEYENLKTAKDKQEVFKNYMKSFRDYKISPYNPFILTPIKEEVKGVAWEGGFYDSNNKYSGRYSYRIEDKSATFNIEGKTKELIPVNNSDTYHLKWVSKSTKDDQNYIVGVESYDADKQLVVFENRYEIYTSQKEWKAETLNLGTFIDEIKYIKIRLFPSKRTISGELTGTVWFDDISLYNTNTKQNEFSPGNFEVNIDDIDIVLDFNDFNEAGKLYFDEFGFTGYRLSLKGLGGGTFHSSNKGVFEGFEQGTVEYNKLMERYLSQMQNNLEESGWLGNEYIYWFDEPNEDDYPFVKETNALIKKYAPKITTFLTEHVTGQDISDVTDISCTIWHRLNHDKIKKMNEKGLENWSYLCTAPKSPWITLFIDHDAVNLRMWLWGSYKYQLKGILVWATNYWNSTIASPEGYLQNPWEEPMSFVTGYGNPLGKQRYWGNGDGRFFYPINRDPNKDSRTYTGMPVPSLRLEFLRDGIEDYEYFMILEELVNKSEKNIELVTEAKQMLDIPANIFKDEKTYSKNPQDILEYRKKIAGMIVRLMEK